MERRRATEKKVAKHYTFNVFFSFDMQFTFTDSEIQRAEEGEQGDINPANEALTELVNEVKEYLQRQYTIGKIEASADFDSLLGVTEE